MKSYSITRMRAECQVVFQLLIGEAVMNLICAAVCGAMWKALGTGETKAPLIITGIFAALFLFVMGFYLVASDIKWMKKHTLYGKTLESLGGAEELMAEIDREAREMDYEGSRFALMRHWLVLYQWSSKTLLGGGVIRSLPIPRNHVQKIAWERDSAEENGGYLVHVFSVQGMRFTIYAWEQADIEALRSWGAVQEKQEI